MRMRLVLNLYTGMRLALSRHALMPRDRNVGVSLRKKSDSKSMSVNENVGISLSLYLRIRAALSRCVFDSIWK